MRRKNHCKKENSHGTHYNSEWIARMCNNKIGINWWLGEHFECVLSAQAYVYLTKQNAEKWFVHWHKAIMSCYYFMLLMDTETSDRYFSLSPAVWMWANAKSANTNDQLFVRIFSRYLINECWTMTVYKEKKITSFYAGKKWEYISNE